MMFCSISKYLHCVVVLRCVATTALAFSTSAATSQQPQQQDVWINNQRWNLAPAGSVFDYECAAKTWLEQVYNPLAELLCREASYATWNYSTTLNVEAADRMADRERQQKAITDRLHHIARRFNIGRLEADNNNEDNDAQQTRRQIDLLQRADTFSLSASQERHLSDLIKRIRRIYDNVSVCRNVIYKRHDRNVASKQHIENNDDDDDLFTAPAETNISCAEGELSSRELNEIMSASRDERLLARTWEAFHHATGDHIRPLFYDSLALLNKRAQLNNHSDYGAVWRLLYTSDSYSDAMFQQNLELLWRQMRPVYEQLHAYVRKKLIIAYPTARIRRDGPIPAHLLNNMWAQSWERVYDLSAPFPHVPPLDLTQHIRAKNYTGENIIRLVDRFFIGLGFDELPETFYAHSIFTKPPNATIQCHAAAYDMCDGTARLLMCMQGVAEELFIAFHEIGHIQFYFQSRHLPYLLRSRANPGLHEAIGDSIALSARSPANLARMGLIDPATFTNEHDINNLYAMAIDKLAFLPFSLIVDYWRWAVFNGSVRADELNKHWWQLRHDYQGVEPPRLDDDDYGDDDDAAPSVRGEQHLDAASKFHVAYGQPYVRYFVAALVQFQFYEAFCRAAGHNNNTEGKNKVPLHHCDISGSREAGDLLRSLMRQGGAREWQDLLAQATGSARMDACPMIRYFEPLLEWIVADNAKTGETIGWASNKHNKGTFSNNFFSAATPARPTGDDYDDEENHQNEGHGSKKRRNAVASDPLKQLLAACQLNSAAFPRFASNVWFICFCAVCRIFCLRPARLN